MPFGKSFGFQVPDSSPPQAQAQAKAQAQSQARGQNPFSILGRDDREDGSDGGSHDEGSMSDVMDEDPRPESPEGSSADEDDDEDDDDDDIDGIDDDNLEKAKSNGLVGTIYSLNGGKSSFLNDSMNKSVLWHRQLQKSIPRENIDLARTIKSVASSVEAAPLHEPDEVILQTENTLRLMYRGSRNDYSTDSSDAIYGAAETLAGNMERICVGGVQQQ